MTPNNKIAVAAAALVGALAFASAAEATLARAIPFDEKVDNAAAIVLGKCVSTRSAWDSEHRFILTYSTFQVEKSLKGQPGQTVEIVTPGGTVDGIRQSSIGIPSFQQGDEQVVFVKNTPAGPTVLYFDQGAYDVATASNGEKSIAPIATSVAHIDTQRGMAAPAESPRTLQQFEQAIRDSVQRRHAQQMEIVRQHQRQPESISATLLRYKYLVAIAILGLALATWQFFRR